MTPKEEMNALLSKVSDKIDDTIRTIKSKTLAGNMSTISKIEAVKIMTEENEAATPEKVKAALIKANAALDKIKSSISS